MLKPPPIRQKAQVEEKTSQWSTQKVKDLLVQYDRTGVMPKDNPFFDRDVNLRGGNLIFGYTPDELRELTRITDDILYLAETHCTVMTDEGIRVVKMRKYQKKVLLQFKRFRFNVFLASRQCGKCVTYDTMVVYVDEHGVRTEVPIFELYYLVKEYLTGWHKLERQLYRWRYQVLGWRRKVEARIAVLESAA